MHLREFTLDDVAAAQALWTECGLHPSRSDTPEGFARKLTRDPDLFLVVEDGGRLVATIVGSWDGRRGWINRLAVAPSHRGRDLARRLVEEVERRLLERGCDRVTLHIEHDNAAVADFYARLGYEPDPLIVMAKWLR